MKKFIAVLVVLAIAGISSIALAADVTVGGSVQIRSRDFQKLNMDKNNPTNQVDTQDRIMLDVNAKSEGAKAKISLWNDFNTWGGASGGRENTIGVGFGNSGSDGGTFGFREAWIMFDLPGIPVTVKGGHQLLQVGHGWFFRSQHFGSDAWVAFNDTGNNHVGFVNVKASEGATGQSDDIDAYVILDTFKINENNKVGADFSYFNDHRGAGLPGAQAGYQATPMNLGVNYTGKLGPVALKAQLDVQGGKAKGATTERKYKGNEIVVQGNVDVAPATVNFLVARGSGPKSGQTDVNQFWNLMDVDPHYTFLYEYKITNPTPGCTSGTAGRGFCNMTVISAGASMAVAKTVTVGLDVYMLQATEKIDDLKDTGTATTNDIGTEVDAIVKWKMSDNLAWNWNFGYLKPGKGLSAAGDAAMGAMGVLAYTF